MLLIAAFSPEICAAVWMLPPPSDSENVTSAFQLILPPVEHWPPYLLILAPLVMIAALVWYSRRKKRRLH